MDADKDDKAVTDQEIGDLRQRLEKVPLHPRLSERVEADRLAKRLLGDPSADPDDKLRMLARQLLRRNEQIDLMAKELYAQQDPTLDLINANRDSILKVYEEGMRRIRKCLVSHEIHDSVVIDVEPAKVVSKLLYIMLVINAVNSFHPMHGESWCGWPKESDG